MKGIAPPPAPWIHSGTSRGTQDRDLLGNFQQIIPVHTLVFADFKVLAYPACVNHNAPLWIGFWVEEVIAFRTKVEGGLKHVRITRILTRPYELIKANVSSAICIGRQSWTNRPC